MGSHSQLIMSAQCKDVIPQTVIIFGCWMCCDQNASGDGIWKKQRRFMMFVCHQLKLHDFRYLNVSLFSN